jgi:hypothetical protein
VANFEYIEEAEAVAVEEAQKSTVDNKPTVNNTEKTNYWEELLRDSYEVHKVEEFNALGKGKRSRKQVLYFSFYDILIKITLALIVNDLSCLGMLQCCICIHKNTYS